MAEWGYRPKVKASPGFVGSSIPFRRKGVYIEKGRRRIPVAEVSELWLQGFSVREIVDKLGWFKGTKFTVPSIIGVISKARRCGNPALFPIRRSADDMEPDYGIDEATQRRLGL